MHTPPRPVRILTLILGVIVTLTALAGVGISWVGVGDDAGVVAADPVGSLPSPDVGETGESAPGTQRQRLWLLMGYEGVLLLTGVLTTLAGTGRFSSGFGMACATLGGTVVGAAVLGWVDAQANLTPATSPFFSRLVTPTMLVRVVCGFAIAGCGGVAVLARRPQEWRRFALGVVLTAPVLIALGAIVLGKTDSLLAPREGTAETLRIAGMFIGGVLAIVLLSAGGHLLITAFERCRDESEA